jgi:hypothetical protein
MCKKSQSNTESFKSKTIQKQIKHIEDSNIFGEFISIIPESKREREKKSVGKLYRVTAACRRS